MKKTLIASLSAAMIAAFVTVSGAAFADTTPAPAKPADKPAATAPVKKDDKTKKTDKKDDKKPAAPAAAPAPAPAK